MNNIQIEISNKSNLMKAYNKARLARVFDPKRLNRAFGIIQSNSTRLLPDGRLEVQSKSSTDFYWSTISKCDCKDCRYNHPRYCACRIAKMLVVKAQRLQVTK